MIRALSAAAILCFAVSCVRRDPPPNYAGSQYVGRSIALELPVHRAGGVVDLAEQKGKVVLVDVWATWCEPCVVQLQMYEDLQKEYGDRGFQVYTVNVDDNLRQVDKFVDEQRLTLPVLLDPNSALSEKALGVNQLPTSFLVDRKGVIRQVHEGFNEEFLGGYQREIEALLAEKP